jgi:hypothetical protein
MDLMFLLTHFQCTSFQSYTDMKALLRQYFPVVYDESRRHGMFDSVEERQHQSFQSVPKAVTENHALQNKIAVVAVLAITIPAIRTKNTRLRTTPS